MNELELFLLEGAAFFRVATIFLIVSQLILGFAGLTFLAGIAWDWFTDRGNEIDTYERSEN